MEIPVRIERAIRRLSLRKVPGREKLYDVFVEFLRIFGERVPDRAGFVHSHGQIMQENVGALGVLRLRDDALEHRPFARLLRFGRGRAPCRMSAIRMEGAEKSDK